MKQFLFLFLTLGCLFTINLEAQTNHKNHSWDNNSAFLGIDSDEVSSKKAKAWGFENPHGKLVERVVKNSAADRAGLQPFDYLYQINEREFSSNYGLSSALASYEEDEEVVLYFVRDGKKLSKKVKLGGSNDRGKGYKSSRSSEDRPFLGVSHISNKSDGVQVNITRNSTAEKAGMNDGDILTRINDYRIMDWGDVTTALRTVNVGEEVKLNYIGDGGKRQVKSIMMSAESRHRQISDSFEETMEAFGESMEKLGESIEENADDWEENFENKVENWAEHFEDKVDGIFDKSNRDSHHNSAFLGINFHRLSADKARFLEFENRYGSYVEDVIGNTAAANAGLQVFDYIYGIDEYRTGENQSLGSILHKFEPGDQAEVLFIRKGKKQRNPITFLPKSEATQNKVDKCEEAFLGVNQASNNGNSCESVAVNPIKNSTALAIGLKDGDNILKINDYSIYDWTDVGTAVDAMTPGQKITVLIQRDGKESVLGGPIKSRKETSDCTDYNSDNNMNFNFDFDFDNDDEEEDENTFSNANPQRNERVDISDMEVKVEDLTGKDADEMRAKYGVDMPVVSNLQVSQVNVFPNPSMGMFTLKFDLPQRGDTAIRIFNTQGREIYNYELSDFTGEFEDNIDISQNGAGSYFLAVTQSGKTMTRKIILQKR